MIDGITVLNTIENTATFATFIGEVVGFTFIIMAIALLIKERMKYPAAWALLALGVVFVVVAVAANAPAAPTYEVLIDDSVSFMDFYERYYIVSQRGDIFTIVVK